MTLHLTVIAKSPVPGRVKTRLCPPCTPQEAADLAAAALADTLDAVLAVIAAAPQHSLRPVLLFDGAVPSWVPAAFTVVEQSGGTLGDRLAAGFDRLGPGLVVGMETPDAVALLTSALDPLAAGGDVLAPALDGGYWAIGLGALPPGGARRAFDGVAMSTADTGAQQLARLCALGRRPFLLPAARDIDHFEDVVALVDREVGRRTGAVARALVARHRPGHCTVG